MAVSVEKIGSVLISEAKTAIVRALSGGRSMTHDDLRRTVGIESDRLFSWHLRGLVTKGILARSQRGNEADYSLTAEGREIARRLSELDA